MSISEIFLIQFIVNVGLFMFGMCLFGIYNSAWHPLKITHEQINNYQFISTLSTTIDV